MLTDLRDALRQLRKATGFTATAVITLALGIGATTAIFTLIHQVMLKSLPVANPEELWRIGDKIRCCNWGGYLQGEDGNFSLFSWETYKYFRARTPEFTDLAALQAGNAPLGVRRAGAQAAADTRNGEYVSGNFFKTFGVQPWIGRMMTDADDQEGAPPVAVMSYRIWKGKYGSDPSVVGASYQINGHPFTVIGVAAPGFYGAKLAGGGMPDFWLPLTSELIIDGATARLKRPNGSFLDIIGRVRPGVNPKSLEAELRVELHSWLASHVPDMEPGEKQLWQQQTLHLTPGGAGVAAMRDQYQDGLKLLLVAAGCVLLVACGNLANLMLARGLKDRAQTSVRMALGASRQRLVRKALVESVLLSVIGGAVGVAVAYAGTRLILYLAFEAGGPNNYVPVDATPSLPVLLFSPGNVAVDRDSFWYRAGVGNFTRRSGRSPAWCGSFCQRTALMGTEVSGHRAGGDVSGTAVGSGAARPKPAQFGAPEFRFRDRRPLYRRDQSHAGQLQAGATGTLVPADRRAVAPNSRRADGRSSALCTHDGRQLERWHSGRGQAGARGKGRHKCVVGTRDARFL